MAEWFYPVAALYLSLIVVAALILLGFHWGTSVKKSSEEVQVMRQIYLLTEEINENVKWLIAQQSSDTELRKKEHNVRNRKIRDP